MAPSACGEFQFNERDRPICLPSLPWLWPSSDRHVSIACCIRAPTFAGRSFASAISSASVRCDKRGSIAKAKLISSSGLWFRDMSTLRTKPEHVAASSKEWIVGLRARVNSWRTLPQFNMLEESLEKLAPAARKLSQTTRISVHQPR